MTGVADPGDAGSRQWCRTAVDVATVWRTPDSPRPVDAPAVADVPDVRAWAATLDPVERLDLHGRTETQLLRGEPVLVVETTTDWSRVVAPWQPSPKDPRGYPGWVRRAHLATVGSSLEDVAAHGSLPVGASPHDRGEITDSAREFVGLSYLWGGTSPLGFDCSGLVHYCYRRAGIRIPRDASAQQSLAMPVALGTERPGDLYFFGTKDRVSHVGFVTGRQRMLHAPEDEGRGAIEEIALTEDRLSTLVSVGRLQLG